MRICELDGDAESQVYKTTLDQIRDASGGGVASSSFVRKLRQKSRLKAHPYGQDILGIIDLYRRAASKHDYVKAVIQKGDYMVVVMQTDGQAALSGKLRFIQADSTFGSLNRSVTIFRAMVIGTTADMYEELFEQYFRVAAANGLAAPRISDRESGGGARQQRTPFVSVTMDFETGQHIGCFRALARVFGGQPENYHGRVVGCSVHFKRFLLGPCGNNLDDPFFIHMTRLRESDTDHGIEDVRAELMTTSSACAAQGETRKANIIRWLLQNEPALLAAFPRATGVLGKIELLASYSDTNSRESLNRQTKQVVSEKGASTLLDVVSALSEFDHATMASMTSPGRVVPTGDSQMALSSRSFKLF
eukprot:contig_7579_g1772